MGSPFGASPAEPGLAARIARHRAIGDELQRASDDELIRLLAGSGVPDRGNGTISLARGPAQVFVKLLPLSAVELENRNSTANFFQLPARYHYRFGSCGFGAWRELEIHRMTNEWVISGVCPRFPLLHGCRVLPLVKRGQDPGMSAERWGPDPAIRRRVAAMAEATSSAVLFLEHFPRTLGQRLRERLPGTRDPLADVPKIEASLLELLAFLPGQGVLHLDSHLENILDNGSGLFLADHGLAISRTFQLDDAERAFFERHQNFDRCTAITGLIHSIVARTDSAEDWRRTLRAMLAGSHPGIAKLPAALRSYLTRRGPLALEMGDFYRRWMADFATEYPATTLQELLEGSSS